MTQFRFTIFAVVDASGNHLGTISAYNLAEADVMARNIYVGGQAVSL